MNRDRINKFLRTNSHACHYYLYDADLDRPYIWSADHLLSSCAGYQLNGLVDGLQPRNVSGWSVCQVLCLLPWCGWESHPTS